MLWAARADGACVFRNQAWLSFRGRTLDEELGDAWLDGVHVDDQAAIREEYFQSVKIGRPFVLEYRLRRADGEYRWICDQGLPWQAPDGTHLGALGSAVDVTEQRIAVPAAADSERRLKTLIENARDMVYRSRVFPTRAIEYIGGAVEAITGRRPEDFYADADLARKAVHPEDAPLVFGALVDPARMQPTVTLRWIHPDGRVVFAEHRRVPVFDASGRLIAVEGIARDITSLIENQQRRRESEDQMRQLAARLQGAREEERAQVARELHDELGQTLTALKLEIGRMLAVLSQERLTPNVVDRLQSLIGLSDIGLATVKRIATNLRPPTLDHLGLAEAIHWEAMTFKARTGIRCHLRAGDGGKTLSGEQQTALFRIFQEALTNIVRHAQASAVAVSLTERVGRFELRIADNGTGITDAQVIDPRSIGLLGMRERAALVGGTFRIAGRRGKGTTVTVQVPLPGARTRARRSAGAPKAGPASR